MTGWLRPLREAAAVVEVRRFDTLPSQQVQADWGHLGSITSEVGEQQLGGFTMTHGYGRKMSADVATDQKLGTLLRMHEAAFQ